MTIDTDDLAETMKRMLDAIRAGETLPAPEAAAVSLFLTDQAGVEVETDPYQRQRIRKITAEAEAKELYASQLRGELVSLAELEYAWGERAKITNSMLSSLVDRLPGLLVGLNRNEMRARIELEVAGILAAYLKPGGFFPDVDLADDDGKRDPG